MLSRSLEPKGKNEMFIRMGLCFFKKHKMLPSEGDSLDINYNRTCDVIKEECIPLRIIKNWFP